MYERLYLRILYIQYNRRVGLVGAIVPTQAVNIKSYCYTMASLVGGMNILFTSNCVTLCEFVNELIFSEDRIKNRCIDIVNVYFKHLIWSGLILTNVMLSGSYLSRSWSLNLKANGNVPPLTDIGYDQSITVLFYRCWDINTNAILNKSLIGITKLQCHFLEYFVFPRIIGHVQSKRKV